MNQPFKDIHTSAASPPSPPHALSLLKLNLENLHPPYTQTCVSCQLCSTGAATVFVEGEMKKVARDGESEVVDLKVREKKRRGSLILEILDPPPPPSAK